MSSKQSPSAANTRRYVVIHEDDGEGEYGFPWSVSLSVRLDGLRFRSFRRGFAWVGNEGGVHDSVVYLSPAEARELWDADYASLHDETFDEAVAAALKR